MRDMGEEGSIRFVSRCWGSQIVRAVSKIVRIRIHSMPSAAPSRDAPHDSEQRRPVSQNQTTLQLKTVARSKILNSPLRFDKSAVLQEEMHEIPTRQDYSP
jgi:hypothetical protein